MHVGFVGAGRMGLPMITRLTAAGHTVRALARRAGAHPAITAAGAEPVTTPGEVTTGADAVIICVFDDDQVREICLDGPLLGELAAGGLVIVHTTGHPGTVTTVAAAHPHLAVVDAPVSGGPHDIAAGTLTVFLGGTRTARTTATAILRAYADPILPVGDLGDGQRVKLVNNILFAAQIGLVTEAIRLGTHLGLPESALLTALPHASSSGNALSRIAGRGSTAEFRTTVGEFLRKDVAVAGQVAGALGADLGLLDAAVRAGLPPERAPR